MSDKLLSEHFEIEKERAVGYSEIWSVVQRLEVDAKRAVKKLKENKYLFNTKYWITISEEEIDKIMGNFNHRHSEGTVNGTVKEDTHVKKYTKKYSKRNGIHQVGLKEDKQ